ncbi:MAG: HEAT repeat domain-containing protein [Acidobacteriota bacterium]|jgi:HEAT repeat protein
MSASEQSLAQRWRSVALGKAGSQEKIDLAWETGESKSTEFAPELRRLLEDDDEEVRYYTLQSLVLQLHEHDSDIQQVCWRLLETDDDDDVRSMAATCLGRIYSGSGDLRVFSRLVEVLKDQNQSGGVQRSAYEALFDLAGRPPREWPSLQVSWRRLHEMEIDWAKVAELEDSINANRSSTSQ